MPKQRDPTALVKAVASVVREQIAKAANALTGRIEALERTFAEFPTPKDGRDGIDGKDGRDGIDGKSASVDDLLPTVKDWFDAIPKPLDGKDGRDGTDGKSVTVDDLRPMVEDFLKSIPTPQNGRDGVDGKSVSAEDLLPTVQKWFEEYAATARQHIESIPAPKDGRDGIDGKSVTVDDVLPLFNQAFDKWALDFERRAQDIHTRLLASFDKPKDGRDGIDGKDGTDGLGFDDIDITHDGERGFTIAVVRGERRKEFTFQLPVVLERGVYKAGHEYARGDGVTADGSYWIAQKDSPSGRPGQSPDWRLAVKRGRDGKGS